MPYAVCTTYAGIPDSSQCSAGWKNFWRNTLLGKFSMSEYLWNLRTESGQLYWTSTDYSLFNLRTYKLTCIDKSVSKSEGVKSDNQSINMEEVKLGNYPGWWHPFGFHLFWFLHNQHNASQYVVYGCLTTIDKSHNHWTQTDVITH